MKICVNCKNKLEDDAKFCSNCGGNEFMPDEDIAPRTEETGIYCPNCHADLTGQNAAFCPNCGHNLSLPTKEQQNAVMGYGSAWQSVKEKAQNNAFLQSVQKDFANSEAVKMMKDGVHNTAAKVKSASPNKQRNIMIAAVAVFVVLLLVVITNIHRCEECGDVYFGKKNTISFFGQTEDVCKDCYEDFYSFSW